VVDTREIMYHGLLLRIVPSEDRPFYLSGDKPSFKLTVKNTQNEERKGKLVFTWHQGGIAGAFDLSVVDINIKPNAEMEHTIESPWLYYEGSAFCSLQQVGSPEDLERKERDELKDTVMAGEFEPICAFKVLDKAIYEEERKRYEILLRKQEDVKESIEKLKEDMIKIAREEARKEVWERLATALRLTFAPPKEEEENEEKEKARYRV